MVSKEEFLAQVQKAREDLRRERRAKTIKENKAKEADYYMFKAESVQQTMRRMGK